MASFGGPVAVPAAGIECLIIKFDPCVCFDYCSVLTSEAPRPWGGGGGGDVNRLILVVNSSSIVSVCVCVVII